MNNKTTRTEEVYQNSKYPEKIMQVIRFKKDPKEENNCYYRIMRKSEQNIAACFQWNYLASYEINNVLKIQGWVKIK